MRTITRAILAACCVGGVAVETLTPVYAQYYYPPPPGYGRLSDIQWMPTRLHGTGRKLCTLPRSSWSGLRISDT